MLIDAIRLGHAGEARITLASHMLAPGSTVAKEVFDLISIAQHYEYGSLMVNVSTSIHASVWFATRDWKTGKVAGSSDGSPGVIYRIDAKKMEGILDRHISRPGAVASPAFQAMGIFGLADIRQRFTFLDRRRSQHGGSLLGMENVVTHFLMHINEAIEAFRHSSVTGSETTVGNHLPALRSGCRDIPSAVSVFHRSPRGQRAARLPDLDESRII
jgi:hypothetical protein